MSKLLEAMYQYEDKIGIKAKIVPNPIEEYLNMPREQMRRLTHPECREIALCLTQYALFIQRCYNEKMNEYNFVKTELDRTIVSDMQQYQAPTTDERRLLAIRNNEAARKLESQKNLYFYEANQIANLAGLIKEMAKAYDQLGWSKR